MAKEAASKEVLGLKGRKESCGDSKCPFHGQINVKKGIFVGKVVKKDISRSATIEWFWPRLVPKYERFETRKVRLRVHNPPCLNAQVGDKVKVARTRPLSKTKHYVIIQKFAEGTEEKTEGITEEKNGEKTRKR